MAAKCRKATIHLTKTNGHDGNGNVCVCVILEWRELAREGLRMFDCSLDALMCRLIVSLMEILMYFWKKIRTRRYQMEEAR